MSSGLTGLGLSPIPTAVNRFPTEGLFTNMAHLFWNLPDDDRMRMYPWLIWFIWKARNDKVFSNGDWDPYEIINHAAAEASAWASSDTSGRRRAAFGRYGELRFSGDRCQVDGAWKETDPRAGLGWYNYNMETGEVLWEHVICGGEFLLSKQRWRPCYGQCNVCYVTTSL
ncbi:unnamed protein product [Microthlaspi erraticum]|uniref:Uncharacterized protein n=1 Tax=Microthlaspi erraticum TaxID=1685480 RepID=A0A6D2HEG2_9BRAS|nr:unnamed protein product [Microthlaspi erraticum]